MSTPAPSLSPAPSRAPALSPTPAGPGRPRDQRIDDAVVRATRELLEEIGYLQLTIAAIADRAGTNKPAIYRRWPSKAHLVHESVFPTQGPEVVLDGEDLRGDIRALVLSGLETLGNPAARAALPGLMAEMATDPDMHLEVLGRFARGTWGWLQDRLDRAVELGEVRPEVESSTVLELIAGSTLIATTIRPIDDTGSDWVDRIVDVIVRGISP